MPLPTPNTSASPRQFSPADFPQLVGAGSVAAALGVSRQAVFLQVQAGKCVVRPVASYNGNFLWPAASVAELGALIRAVKTNSQ